MSKKARYSDGDRVNALAVLTANAGNIRKTAETLGIPRTTLKHWSRGTRHPEAIPAAVIVKANLADQLEALAVKLIGVASQKADQLNAKDAVIAAAVAVDKMRLLRGEATAAVETRGDRMAIFRERYATGGLTDRIDELAAAFEGVANRTSLPSANGEPVGNALEPV